VFIRSMASRGSLGGLAQATASLAQVFDAAGYEVVMIETVGAGQSEVDIAKLAHTTIVVEAPGLGDDIQAIKAGILEIADIIVVNKADRPGAENTEKSLKSMLDLAHPVRHVFQHHGRTEIVDAPAGVSKTVGGTLRFAQSDMIWIPPIQRTVSTEGAGIPELAKWIAKHLAHLRQSGDWAARERARLEVELEALVREALVSRFRESLPKRRYDEMIERVVARSISPWEAARLLLDGRSK